MITPTTVQTFITNAETESQAIKLVTDNYPTPPNARIEVLPIINAGSHVRD